MILRDEKSARKTSEDACKQRISGLLRTLVEILGTFREHLHRLVQRFLLSLVVGAAAVEHRAARQVCWDSYEVVENSFRFCAVIEAAQKRFIFAEAHGSVFSALFGCVCWAERGFFLRVCGHPPQNRCVLERMKHLKF